MPDDETFPDEIFNVLFICTSNSARSILAEAILNRDGEGRFRGFSAGSFPAGEVDPHALRVLDRLGFGTAGLRSKSWDEFAEAPEMDFVFTVCDDAAGEACPVWSGHPITAHWGIEDPTLATGDDAEREHAFTQALRFLENRISLFVSLPIEKLDGIALHEKVKAIGRAEGASARAAGG